MLNGNIIIVSYVEWKYNYSFLCWMEILLYFPMLIGNIIIVSYVEWITETWNQSWQRAVTVNGPNNCLFFAYCDIFNILTGYAHYLPVIAIVNIGVNDIDCNILLLQIPTDWLATWGSGYHVWLINHQSCLRAPSKAFL